jgi:hypothetical protein
MSFTVIIFTVEDPALFNTLTLQQKCDKQELRTDIQGLRT